MTKRFRLFRRGNMYWCQDHVTRKQESLRTAIKSEAERLLHARNEAHVQPCLNLQIARAYLRATDPEIARRTWQVAMDQMTRLKRGSTHHRYTIAMADSAFDLIRNRPILETQAQHFLRVLESGTVSTNVFLRRLQNFAISMDWIPWNVLPKALWPTPGFREKRAITSEEHCQIVDREPNPEWKAYFQALWHIGGAQTDIALLRREDFDEAGRVIGYVRRKTGSVCMLRYGDKMAALLAELPRAGLLFPRIAELHEKHRAKHFRRRCLGLGLTGICLHSYRYSWAERAKSLGYPERFAQEALGHGSKAVHRAYARKARVTLPSLEEYERATLEAGKTGSIVQFPTALAVPPGANQGQAAAVPPEESQVG